MKKHFASKFILSLVLSLSSYVLTNAQIICIYCYDQNDSMSAGVNNMVLNGGFESTPCPPSTGVIGSMTSFCPNSAGYVCDFDNWTASGGGHDTYACLYNLSINKSFIPQGNNAVYFGNFYANACNNNQSNIGCITDLGCTSTGIPNGYPKNTSAYGGTAGVSLSQTVSGLIPGNPYVLEFWAGGEESYTERGLFALDIGFGDTMMRCKSTSHIDGIGTRYIVEFLATSNSHTIKFTSWGHVGNSSELVLDDVKLYTLAELSPLVPACASIPNPGSFAASDTNVCQKFCVDFYDSSTNNPIAWEWIFEGGAPATSSLQNPTGICYAVPGVYDVTLITTNANGNDTVKLDNYITVNPTPPFPSITQNGYTLTSSVANSYQWQLDAVDIPGATNQSYDVLQTGTYSVVISDLNGCVNSTSQYVLISGLGNVVNELGVSVFPNPSNGNFIVELFNGLIAGDATFKVVNTLGQVIYSSQENVSLHFKKEIQLSKVAGGVYFISITSQNISFQQKIIIAK